MDVSSLLLAVVLALVGSSLGGSCALVPGFHANTLSLVLLLLFPLLSPSLASLALLFGVSVPPALLFAVLLVSAATAHSFVDFVPSTFLGVPDEGTVLSMLPAHRLLHSGKGMEAIGSAATGSLCGALIAILLVVPVQLALQPPSLLGEALHLSVPYLLLGVIVLLVLTERGHEAPRAHLDIRSGEVLDRGLVSIRPPVPVHGEQCTISGRVARRGLLSFQLQTPHMRLKVVSGLRVPAGFLTVRGTWVVRRVPHRARLVALAVIFLSGLLGFVVMNARPLPYGAFDGLGQSPLFPLLSGLFAFPALLSAMRSRPVPPQDEASDACSELRPALIGTFAGFLAGWMPGITSTIGTVIGTVLTPGRKEDAREASSYILMLSAVGTSSVVFSLLALTIEGKGRTGAMLALKDALGEEGLKGLSFLSEPMAMLLVAVLVASAVGYHATLRAGSLLARKATGRDLRGLNLFVLLLLLAMTLLFNGLPGLMVAGAACLVGSLPPGLGVRRVHLTGCLLLPLLIFYLGLEDAVVDLVW